MNNKIIMIATLSTALNANAQYESFNCDSTCANTQNINQMQNAINSNSTTTGRAVMSDNFNTLQNNSQPALGSYTAGNFITSSNNPGLVKKNEFTNALSCPAGYAALPTSNGNDVWYGGYLYQEYLCVRR